MTDVGSDDSDRLEFDIAYALSRSNLRPKMHVASEPCHLAAKNVIEHLKLCGWEFHKKPSAPPHSTPHSAQR